MGLAVLHQFGVVEGEVFFLLLWLLGVLQGGDGVVGLGLGLEQDVLLGERDVLFRGGVATVPA